MKLKHTPGEWLSRKDAFNSNRLCYRYIVYERSCLMEIAKINSIDFAKADACLIAAAPEMLECLIDEYKRIVKSNIIGEIEKVKIVIEKATDEKIEDILKEQE